MITTLVVLYAAKMNKSVQFQDFDRSILLKVSISLLKKNNILYFLYLFSCTLFSKLIYDFIVFQIFPLPLLYVGNHITGLASTKKLRFNPLCLVLSHYLLIIY